MTALYFSSRKRFSDKNTWKKEKLPLDFSNKEVEQAAYLAGCEGYAIVKNFATTNKQVLIFKWFI